MTTIGQAVSRVRNVIKAVKTDAFITDRFIYSLILKYANLYIKQELEKGKYMAFSSLYKTLPCVDLIAVDKVEACCDIQSGCTIMRTKDKLPDIMSSMNGLMIRSVTSIDGSQDIALTTPLTYSRFKGTSGAKYNNLHYYWPLNGYLYFPDLAWAQVKLDALFPGSIASLQCDSVCEPIQDSTAAIPEYMYALIEQGVLKDFGMSVQVPVDQAVSDKQSLQKP